MKRFTTKDGLSLAYRDEGTGDALLCLAGLTRNSRDFDQFAEIAVQTHRVVRLDARGRGASDHAKDFHTYNVASEAADAVALLDHLGIERTAVIGSSRGGIQAMVIAATAPQRLAGVVLNDVGPELSLEGLTKIMGYLGLPPKSRTFDEAAAAMEAVFGRDFPGVGTGFWRDLAERSFVECEGGGLDLAYDPKLRDATEAQVAAADPDGPGLWPLYMALGPIPTLVLRGENSDLLSKATLAAMVEKKPDLLTATVRDRGHIPRLDEPDAVKPIMDFLEGLK